MDYYLCLDQYIEERRKCGYSLKRDEGLLRNIVDYAYANDFIPFSNKGFLSWKRDFGSANDSTWKRRLSVYRGFAKWLKQIEPKTEVPPSNLIASPGFSRVKPYIYNHEEIINILSLAAELKSSHGLKGLAYNALFGLISVTGMRLGEALGLLIQDVDLDNLTIYVRNAKNNKERVIPISDSMADVLDKYDQAVEDYVTVDHTKYFVIENGKPINSHNAQYCFAKIGQKLGLRDKPKFHEFGIGPRIHDLRHTFAVNSLVTAFETNDDIDVVAYKLSCFLGHEKVDHR